MDLKKLPIFTTEFSIGKSIITLNDPKPLGDQNGEFLDFNRPISLFEICKHHNINELCLVENSFSGTLKVLEKCKELGIKIRFGLKIAVCEDVEKKDDDSRKTESQVIIFAKNQEGYHELMKIYTDSFNYKYYYNRIDWKLLKDRIQDNNNLLLAIPFYDSFLHNNLLKGFNCVPEINLSNAIFLLEEHNLPIDNLLLGAVKEYISSNNYKSLESHSIYYYLEKDFKQYNVMRCIQNQSAFGKPNIDGFCSDKFAFETLWNRES